MGLRGNRSGYKASAQHFPAQGPQEDPREQGEPGLDGHPLAVAGGLAVCRLLAVPSSVSRSGSL